MRYYYYDACKTVSAINQLHSHTTYQMKCDLLIVIVYMIVNIVYFNNTNQ